MYRATYRGFKSLILRSETGNSPDSKSPKSLNAEPDDFYIVTDVPISKEFLRKITAERARRERPDFSLPGLIDQVHIASVGAPLQQVIRSAPEVTEKVEAPELSKVVKLDDGRVSIVDSIQLFGWSRETRFAWQIHRNSLTLIAQEDGEFKYDASSRILVPLTLRRRLSMELNEQVLVVSNSSPIANVQITTINQIHKIMKEAK